MRAPLSWIKEFVSIPDSVTVEQISDALIRVGFEVEEIIVQGSDLTGPLTFARVLSIEEITEFKKPIRYVGLDCGEKETRFVICGATNFAVGDLVVAALPGAKSIVENPRELSPACAVYASATAVLSTSVLTEIAICFPFVFNPRRG